MKEYLFILVLILNNNILTIYPAECSHPFYFGWIDVEFQKKSIGIHARFFADDMEACLRKYHPETDIFHNKNGKNHEILLEYFKKKFSIIYPDGSVSEVWSLTYRTEDDICHIFARMTTESNISSCTIHCELLMDGIAGQTNVVKIISGNSVQTFFFTGSENQKKINIASRN